MHIRRATPEDAHVVLTWLNKKEIWVIDNPNPHEPRSRMTMIFSLISERSMGRAAFELIGIKIGETD